jgi:hypothetical protein
MSDQDAIQSPANDVAIPEHLRSMLHDAAMQQIEEATDLAFVPDMLEAVREAVHAFDDVDRGEASPETIVTLATLAIDAQTPSQMPHNLAEWEALLERLDPVRELVVLIERLGTSGAE